MQKKQHPFAQDIAQILSSSLYQSTLCWVPSHRNIQGNEIADHCAKIALQLSPIQNIPIPLSDLKLFVKSNSVLSFQNTNYEQIEVL